MRILSAPVLPASAWAERPAVSTSPRPAVNTFQTATSGLEAASSCHVWISYSNENHGDGRFLTFSDFFPLSPLDMSNIREPNGGVNIFEWVFSISKFRESILVQNSVVHTSQYARVKACSGQYVFQPPGANHHELTMMNLQEAAPQIIFNQLRSYQ